VTLEMDILQVSVVMPHYQYNNIIYNINNNNNPHLALLPAVRYTTRLHLPTFFVI
jgi:hypothetical protein